MRVSLRSNKGFSLVELMVVVAIIGILAAVAIPNFTRFTAKSKQAEVKADLAALYTSERAFQAEWQTYDSSFTVVGYAPMGSYRYQHGFAAVAAAALPGNYTGPVAVGGDMDTSTFCGQGGVTMTNGCNVIIVPVAPGAYTTAPSVAATTFVASGVGSIGGAATDSWNMNQLKTLTNDQQGLP